MPRRPIMEAMLIAARTPPMATVGNVDTDRSDT
jgi:hypothetical protein